MMSERTTRRPRFLVLGGVAWLGAIVVVSAASPAATGAESKSKTVSASQVAEGDSGAATALARRLAASGRGTVVFVREAEDPFGGEPLRHQGTLVLEPPDRVLLSFASTGEQLALRGDEGQWLQPQLEQMLLLGPDHLEIARLWWGVLLGKGREGIDTVQLGARRYRLITHVEGQAVDSASVWLDRDGLPQRLDFRDDNGSDVRYHFENWRFSKARGARAFVLSAPKGFETVRLP